MAIKVAEVRDIVNHGSRVHGGCRSRQGSNLDEGLHRRAANSTGAIWTLLR